MTFLDHYGWIFVILIVGGGWAAYSFALPDERRIDFERNAYDWSVIALCAGLVVGAALFRSAFWIGIIAALWTYLGS